ncbi:DNase I-like protein [Coemansia reversa NRRL 1564]|uniref:DNase I-like protein n=1 Tax=Coemansia reversa (strain ATCC 12441 / NRRL 1564) TaxID=763665 RepID=A0A2G5BEX5_COERN|nr:DNase I-like protein [Coemansia reversa NRRL 1564]|eukprot:PIA17542.1 DNase I-like protein [Coemansia reversa NRRL 1564]
MQSDDEDSQQPKTLAERIARLGLKTESGTRPTSRTSVHRSSVAAARDRTSTEVGYPDGRTTPMQNEQNPMGAEARPPIAPKTHLANRPYAGSLSFQAGYTHDETEGPATQPPHTDVAAAVQAQHGAKTPTVSHGREADVADTHAVSVRDRIQSLYRERGSLESISFPSATTAQSQAQMANPNPFASPELGNTQVMTTGEDSSGGMCPMSPVSPLPAAAEDFGRSRTNFARHSLLPQSITPGGISPPPQKPANMQHTRTAGHRIDGDDKHAQPQRPMSALGASGIFGHAAPKVPPKPAGIGTPKSPAQTSRMPTELGRSYSVSTPYVGDNGLVHGPRSSMLPPPPPPPPPPPSSHRPSLPLPPPPPPPPPMQRTSLTLQRSQQTAVGGQSNQASHAPHMTQATHATMPQTPLPPPPLPRAPAQAGMAAAGSNTARTALDFSNDAALKPLQLNQRHSNRRAPGLGVQPFLSLETATGPVLSCIGGAYAVVVHQSRMVCTRIDTGEIGAMHNTPGPDERFVSVAAVPGAVDPSEECACVWASTSLGRVLVLSTCSTSSRQEQLQSTSRAHVVAMLAAGAGEMWTLREDGLVEAWRGRKASDPGAPLAPLRRFTISLEMQQARRTSTQRLLLLLRRRELWFAGNRGIWVFDTQHASEPLASVAGSALLSAAAQASSLEAPRVLAQLTLTPHDAGIACLASNAEFLDDRGYNERGFVFAGTDGGHVIVWRAAKRERWRTLDLSNGNRGVRVTALACASERWLWVGLASGRLLVVDTLGDVWTVAKEWQPVESAVMGMHVDWTPLLTPRAKLQVASVHANGSVYYWDGSLAVDRQLAELRRRTPQLASMRDVTVQINSWNIDAVKPEHLERSREDRGFLRNWLGALGAQLEPELVVVGLQEVVDLESKKMTAKSLWRTTTSKNKHHRDTKPTADISKRYGLWRAALSRGLARGAAYASAYRIVECRNLVGLFVCVFARDDVYRAVRDVDVAHVKTGMGGLHGNKGAVAVRLVFADTSFCFVNAHLAAGEAPGNNLARIAHCSTIVRGLSFKRPAPELHMPLPLPEPHVSVSRDLTDIALDAFVDGGDGQRFLDHAACFFSGDLNFRLRTSRLLAERYVEANELEALLHFDQLLPMIASDTAQGPPPATGLPPPLVAAASDSESTPRALDRSLSSSSLPSSSGDEADVEGLEDVGSAGFALRAFHEMPIQFPPTYKYDPGTDRYDSSEKRRIPAWCDRVLFRGAAPNASDTQGSIAPLAYQRFECRQSDHRPIFAAFRVRAKVLDREARARALADIHQQFATRDAAEMVHLAKIMWLARYTATFTDAAELLGSAGGDLTGALQQLLNLR